VRTLLSVSGALALAITVTPALAHDDDEQDTHARAHLEHGYYHEEQAEAHARAHEEGFENRWEHRAYHRALRNEHNEFHEDHPNTRHDHYRWWQYGYNHY
jgi:hypothetical protein